MHTAANQMDNRASRLVESFDHRLRRKACMTRPKRSVVLRVPPRPTAVGCTDFVRGNSSAVLPSTKALGGVSANRTVGGDFGHSVAPGFSPHALRVEGLGSLPFKWSPGQLDSGNLLGTARSLDGITGGIDLNCTN